MQVSSYFENGDYAALRRAAMTGRFTFEFERDLGTGEVTFFFTKGQGPILCRSLERVIDFGATSASEILFH